MSCTTRVAALVGSVLLTAVVVAAPPAGKNRAAADKPMNTLGVRLMSYFDYQADGFGHLKSMGIHYVFMSVPKPEELEAVQKRLAESGLTTPVLRGDSDLGRPTSVEELAAQLAICEKMGAKYMFFSAKHTGVDKETAYQRLRQAGDAAKKHGVTICLETHPDLGTNAAAHLETMRAVNHPNVRVNFDTGNITYYNKDANAPDELKKVIQYVATVEIKDHNGQYMTWNFPALSRGVVDIPAVLKILKEQRYSGPITLEIEGVEGVKRTKEQILREIEQSVAYVRSLGNFK